MADQCRASNSDTKPEPQSPRTRTKPTDLPVSALTSTPSSCSNEAPASPQSKRRLLLKVKLLKVPVQPHWRVGDIVACVVPRPCRSERPTTSTVATTSTATSAAGGFLPDDYNAINEYSAENNTSKESLVLSDELRTIHVEVPENPAEYFFVEFEENDDGVPIPTTTQFPPSFDPAKCEKYPLLTEPVVIPDSAISLKQHSFFNGNFLVYALLPALVYIGLLFLGFWKEFSQDKAAKWHMLWIHVVAALAGYSLVYYRYRKSVLLWEICLHILLACAVMVPLAMYTNTWTYRGIKALFKDVFKVKKSVAKEIADACVDAVVIPIAEEFLKYVALRLVAFRSTVLDPHALIAFGCISGLTFCFFENWWYIRKMKVKEASHWWIRLSGLGHILYTVISAGRLAEWRFLGRKRNMFSVLWPAVVIHLINNSGVVLQMVWWVLENCGADLGDKKHDTVWWHLGIFFNILLIDSVAFVIARYYVCKLNRLPVVDVREVIRTGQIKRRAVDSFLLDTFFWCRKRGLWRKDRHQERPIHHGDVPNPEDIITAEIPQNDYAQQDQALCADDQQERKNSDRMSKLGSEPARRRCPNLSPSLSSVSVATDKTSLLRDDRLRHEEFDSLLKKATRLSKEHSVRHRSRVDTSSVDILVTPANQDKFECSSPPGSESGMLLDQFPDKIPIYLERDAKCPNYLPQLHRTQHSNGVKTKFLLNKKDKIESVPIMIKRAYADNDLYNTPRMYVFLGKSSDKMAKDKCRWCPSCCYKPEPIPEVEIYPDTTMEELYWTHKSPEDNFLHLIYSTRDRIGSLPLIIDFY